MAHFTQLNLQGNSGGKSTPNSQGGSGVKMPAPGKPLKKSHGTAKIAAITGSVAAAAFVTALALGTNGCSKSNKAVMIAPPVPTASVPQPAYTSAPALAIAPTTAKTETPKLVKKHSRQHTISTYKNTDYGISFLYPKTDSLKKGDDANLTWKELDPAKMNFTQPGGTTLAAVQLPEHVYRGTDFASGFFNVSVNPKITSEQCAQFARQDVKSTPASITDIDDKDSMEAAEPAKLVEGKFGAMEYTEAESSGGDKAKHADAKYYHVFQNGACYEFALGLETADSSAAKSVDHDAVFHKLNWILSTVKITTADVPVKAAETAKPDTTKATTLATDAAVSSSAPVTPTATMPVRTTPVETTPATTTSVSAEGGKD